MPAPKGLTNALPFRSTAEERVTLEAVQACFAGHGLKVSLNDVLRHLVRRAGLGIPRSSSDGVRRLVNHMAECDTCEPATPPRCMDGIYLRELNRTLYGAAPEADGPGKVV